MRTKLRTIFEHRPESRKIPEFAVLSACIGGTYLVSTFTTTEELLRYTAKLSSFIPKLRRPTPKKLALLELWANQISKVIPGSHCLHRATGLYLLLSLEGVSSKVVIGFRKGLAIESHAWLEVPVDGNIQLLFSTENEGFDSRWIPH